MDEQTNTAAFAPYCVVAEFADGTRQRFPGLNFENCLDQLEAACNEHGDLAWHDNVTDEYYENGVYYKLVPDTSTQIDIFDYTELFLRDLLPDEPPEQTNEPPADEQTPPADEQTPPADEQTPPAE